MTACQKCSGEGVRDDVDGAEIVCRDCCGLGYVEAATMLATLVAIRDSDRMARALGQPGLGTGLRALIAKAVAQTADYSTERYAEIRAKELVRS